MIMKHYRYTNKDEKPVPRYREGQKVWSHSFLWLDTYNVGTTTIRKVLPPRWVEYKDETPHWVIEYRHQPRINDRMVQCPIDEEELFDTKEEALTAMFGRFKDDTFRQLERFRKQFKALGVEYPNIQLIEKWKD